jgi:hypothetical protein
MWRHSGYAEILSIGSIEIEILIEHDTKWTHVARNIMKM